ncbi:MAG: metalloregulator ArsR/SmtB family transcription factor [Candidatus Thermoplasmatota archaeon]|nr:metalloregulator ArsR/SmtB family transcription factor [Candidatus Thermoplasmatota archaeon]
MVEQMFEQDIGDLGGVEGLRKMAPGKNVIKRLEDLYTILSCSNRILILYYLNFAPLKAGELSEITGMAPNLLSFHLKKLKNARVVRGERDGKFMIYSITDMGRSLTGPLTG